MSINLSLYEQNIRFYFVQINDGIPSDDMNNAKIKLLQCVVKENISTISEEECTDLIHRVDRTHVFIFQSFEGATFETAKREPNAVIIGPRCLYSCLMDNITVPNNLSPIYTLGMRDLVLCMSGMEVEEKKKLEVLIGYMGGRATPQLTERVKYLITENIFTKKYESATTHGMIVMHPDWVRDVWDCSRTENILATNEKFHRHKLPTFYKKRFTSTGLNSTEKKEIKLLLEENGGTYFGSYSSRNIDILIIEPKNIGSEKHKAAESNSVECLNPDWVRDSARKGYAVPSQTYRVVSLTAALPPATSTPDKTNDNLDFTNASIVSRIGMDKDMSVNETMLSNSSIVSTGGRAEATSDKPYKELFEKLNEQAAKRAGFFLDGCCIFVCGFTAEEKDKIVKIVSKSGATRFDTIHADISHIIVGVPNKMEMNLITTTQTAAPLLTLNWLIDSIEQKQAVQELDSYLYKMKTKKAIELENHDTPSPASKKNILYLTNASESATKKGKPKKLSFNETENNPNVSNLAQANHNDDDLVLDQYLAVGTRVNISVTSPSANKSMRPESDNEKSPSAMPPPPVPHAPAAAVRTTSTVSVATASSNDSDSRIFDTQQHTSELTQNLDFLIGKTVCVTGFDTESHDHLVMYCEAAGAEIINNSRCSVDYLITSVDKMTLADIHVEPRYTVNHNWLIASKKVNRAIDIEYYLKPILFPEDLKPLAGLEIVISTYSGDERLFLAQLAEILGGNLQDAYKKSQRPLLICPAPDNAKYNAAIRWNLPVVNREWLLKCYEMEKRLPLRKYLIGDAIVPVDDIYEMCEEAEAPPPIPDPIPSNDNTPVLRHKRVAQLQNRGHSISPEVHKSPEMELVDKPWPLIEEVYEPHEITPEMRAHYNALAAAHLERMENDTPNTKRQRLEEYSRIGSPEIRDFLSPTYSARLHQRFIEEDRRRAEEMKPSPSPEKKKSTPWTIYKRRFWKEALGDQYESPSQCYTANTQVLQTTLNEVHHEQLANDLTDDSNMKKLTDFIKKRNILKDLSADEEALPDSIPYSAEMVIPNTETNELVGWRDPTEIPATPKPAKVRKAPPKNKMKYQNRPRFVVSVTDSILNNITNQIVELNGVVCTDEEKFQREYTHYICETPNRGQNTFACIVSGKWLLHPNYVPESMKVGYFLDEELFEWGNPKAGLDKTPNEMAASAYRWRVRLQTIPYEIPAVGAFKNFRVILPPSTKYEQLKALLEAGGGIVVNLEEPYHNKLAARDATHYIFNKMVLSNDDIKAFKKNNVHCVNFMFLNAWVTSMVQPDVKDYLLK